MTNDLIIDIILYHKENKYGPARMTIKESELIDDKQFHKVFNSLMCDAKVTCVKNGIIPELYGDQESGSNLGQSEHNLSTSDSLDISKVT